MDGIEGKIARVELPIGQHPPFCSRIVGKASLTQTQVFHNCFMPHRLHVYLIDDNVTDLELAREAFGDHAHDVRLTTCSSAESALESLLDPSTPLPDVIVTDLNMPLMSGLELLKVLKGEPKLQCIPVVMLTTSSDAGDVQSAYTLHASSYLVKAETFSKFMTQVDAFVTFWMTARRLHQD